MNLSAEYTRAARACLGACTWSPPGKEQCLAEHRHEMVGAVGDRAEARQSRPEPLILRRTTHALACPTPPGISWLECRIHVDVFVDNVTRREMTRP